MYNRKFLFWISLAVVIVIAADLIGRIFLSEALAGGEGTPALTPTEHFIRAGIYVVVTDLVFSLIILRISFFFLICDRKKIIQILICKFLAIIMVFLGTWMAVTLFPGLNGKIF